MLLALARVIDRATTLVLTLVLATRLGASGVGTYTLALAFYGTISVAAEAGTTLFLIRELAIDRARTGRYVVHLSVLALGAALVLMLAGEGVIRHVGYPAAVQSSLALALLAILPKTLNSIQEAVFVVHGRTEFEAVTTLVSSSIYLAVSVVLLGSGHGVTSIVAVYVGLEYLVTIVYFVLIMRSIARLHWQFHWSLARRLLGEMKSFTASSALAALFVRPEIIILSLLSSTRQVGLYSAAVRVAEIWLFVPEVFLDNVYPVLTRAFDAGGERFGQLQARVLRFSLAYALPLTAGTLALASPIIATLFGHAFGHSAVELQLLALNITLLTVTELYWRSISARGGQSALLRMQMVVIASRLAVGVVLIAAFASLGAAISMAVIACWQALLLGRLLRVSGAPAHPFRVGWRVGLAAGVMGGASWLLGGWLSIWLVIPLAAGTYAVVLLAVRAFPTEDLGTLRRLVAASAPQT